MKKFEFLDAPTIVLLLGLTVGLGIVVHDVFFIVALVIAMVALSQHVAEHFHHARLTHRH